MRQAAGKTTGGQMQVSIAGFPSKELLEWMFRKADKKQKALYAGLSGQPVTYQHLEEFLISLKEKDPVSVSLKTTAAEFYNVEEDMQESFEIHRSGWDIFALRSRQKGSSWSQSVM